MKDKIRTISVFLPIILILLLFFYYPIYAAFSKSLHGLDGTFIGFDRYGELMGDAEFTGAFAFTVEIALISTIISVILSIALALALRETFIGKRLALFLNQINISLPHTIVAVMTLYLLCQKGFVSSIAYHLGLIDSWMDFPRITEGTSPVGAIISYTLKFTPFICLSVLAVLQSMSQDYEDQSLVLGVGKLRTFFHVTLPTIWPAIMSTAIMSFAYAFGSYDVPVVLLRTGVMSTFVYNNYYNYSDPNGILIGSAGSIIMVAITIALSVVFLYISSKRSDALE